MPSVRSSPTPRDQDPPSELAAIVHIIDDDASLRDALDSLFRSVGLETRRYGSAQEFLDATQPDAPGCMVLDVRLRGFQASISRLSSANRHPHAGGRDDRPRRTFR